MMNIVIDQMGTQNFFMLLKIHLHEMDKIFHKNIVTH